MNISDGRTKDGGAVVGTGSVFYDNSENIENNEDSNRKSPGSLEKLDEVQSGLLVIKQAVTH